MTPDPATKSTRRDAPGDGWSLDDARELYRLDAWSDGFFRVNDAGHIAVRPFNDQDLAIDVMDVIAETENRGIRFPLLLRFQDVLRARVRRLNEAFGQAIAEAGYGNRYTGVYPIKVNQLHEVVEEVLDAGRAWGMGLECGSKAELVAALPQLANDDTLLICNGVKDRAMLSLIQSAQGLGKNVIPVMEKFAEFEQLTALAAHTETPARFGVRIRLRTAGAGKWADSGGYRSKFGISLPELIELVERLERSGRTDGFVLLHFHLGSQISDIQVLRQAVREMAQIYASLMERGLELRYFDVGGGLGVNYSGSYSDTGINYSLQEYANTVVYAVMEVCDDRNVPYPVLVSESGRAITAHHSLLVVQALGAYQKDRVPQGHVPPPDAHPMLEDLAEILKRFSGPGAKVHPVSQLLEACHDVVEIHRNAATLFGIGHLSLEQNALIERYYWSCCSAILDQLRAAEPDPVPAEYHELEDKLVDQYLCDFSVFQSMLDHWAIEQPFPIVPLHRLDERPGRRALIVDLTCDSDGKVSHYVSSRDDRKFLELHALEPGRPYWLGFFLMGAYQDIMGDAHNLFGRVSEAHVYADSEEERNFWIEKWIPGIEVQEILAQVQYFPNELERRMEAIVKEKIEAGTVRPKRGMEILEQYTRCFREGTYYDPLHPTSPSG
ncbi:MAG TPA: biosynthetic arginine decarboxylase [Woeseiaceae bacterium]|nr:biosynthetic arginine decarboxylase [Woeseiaceae bacterium]